MSEFLQISDDLFVMPSAVVAVKRASDESCTIFLKGQSSQDGFVIPLKAEDAVEELEQALTDEE